MDEIIENPIKTDQIENVIANATFELEAKDYESIMVTDIILAGVAGKYATVTIDNTTVAYLRYDQTTLGNHLSQNIGVTVSLLKFLSLHADEEGKPIFKGFPIQSGQKLVVKEAAGGTLTGSIIYDVYAPGVIKEDMPNGPKAQERLIISYGRPAADITTATETTIDTIVNPKEFPAFPYGGVIPSKKKVFLYGICASERAKSAGTGGTTNNIRTKYLKVQNGFETLFDKDKQGILALGSIPTAATTFECEKGTSPMGEGTELGVRKPAYMFDTPIEMNAGEELNLSWVTELTAGASTLTKAEAEIAVIFKYAPEKA